MRKLLSILLLLSVFVASIYALTLLPLQPDITPVTEITVINMWHIESWEGGNGSRSGWLNRRMLSYESNHKGVYISITTYTQQQALDKLAQGETFDIISFSIGVGNKLLQYLTTYRGAVGDVGTLLDGGTVNGDVVALPYMTGVYSLIARTSDLQQAGTEILQGALSSSITRKVGKNTVVLQSLQSGFAQYNNSVQALVANGVHGQLQVDYSVTQYSAYENFVKGNTSTILLGTQRDMYRVYNRVEQGRLPQMQCHVVGGYTDLVQYVAISGNTSHYDRCVDVIQHLISDKVQDTLSSIYMLSTTGRQLYTSNSWFAQAQEKVNQGMATVNVFADDITLQANRQQSLDRINEKV